jgi:hypothetical protein
MLALRGVIPHAAMASAVVRVILSFQVRPTAASFALQAQECGCLRRCTWFCASAPRSRGNPVEILYQAALGENRSWR